MLRCDPTSLQPEFQPDIHCCDLHSHGVQPKASSPLWVSKSQLTKPGRGADPADGQSHTRRQRTPGATQPGWPEIHGTVRVHTSRCSTLLLRFAHRTGRSVLRPEAKKPGPESTNPSNRYSLGIKGVRKVERRSKTPFCAEAPLTGTSCEAEPLKSFQELVRLVLDGHTAHT